MGEGAAQGDEPFTALVRVEERAVALAHRGLPAIPQRLQRVDGCQPRLDLPAQLLAAGGLSADGTRDRLPRRGEVALRLLQEADELHSVGGADAPGRGDLRL